jgi:hypothetical protein
MKDGSEKISDRTEAPGKRWPDIAFDATTNFSMLGWFWEKLTRLKRSKKSIDFTLEE